MKPPKAGRNKTYWNYRVIKMPDPILKGMEQTYSWGIYEVYYTDDKPTSWSAEPMHAIGETFNELLEDFHNMQRGILAAPLELKGKKLVETKRFSLPNTHKRKC